MTRPAPANAHFDPSQPEAEAANLPNESFVVSICTSSITNVPVENTNPNAMFRANYRPPGNYQLINKSPAGLSRQRICVCRRLYAGA